MHAQCVSVRFRWTTDRLELVPGGGRQVCATRWMSVPPGLPARNRCPLVKDLRHVRSVPLRSPSPHLSNTNRQTGKRKKRSGDSHRALDMDTCATVPPACSVHVHRTAEEVRRSHQTCAWFVGLGFLGGSISPPSILFVGSLGGKKRIGRGEAKNHKTLIIADVVYRVHNSQHSCGCRLPVSARQGEPRANGFIAGPDPVWTAQAQAQSGLARVRFWLAYRGLLGGSFGGSNGNKAPQLTVTLPT